MELKGLSSAIGVIGTAVSAVNGILRMTIDVETKTKLSRVLDMLIDTQGKLQEAIAATAALERRIVDLEDNKMKIEQFRAEKAGYRLAPKGPGSFVYVQKELTRGEEPLPEFCAACFDQEVKSILQLTRRVPGGQVFGCSRCRAEILVPLESAGDTIESTGRRRSNLDDYLD